MAAASSLVSSPPQHTQVVEGIFFLSFERALVLWNWILNDDESKVAGHASRGWMVNGYKVTEWLVVFKSLLPSEWKDVHIFLQRNKHETMFIYAPCWWLFTLAVQFLHNLLLSSFTPNKFHFMNSKLKTEEKNKFFLAISISIPLLALMTTKAPISFEYLVQCRRCEELEKNTLTPTSRPSSCFEMSNHHTIGFIVFFAKQCRTISILLSQLDYYLYECAWLK